LNHGKSNELIGRSRVSFEDALGCILERANKTLRGVHAVEVLSKSVAIQADGEFEYCVRALLKFAMTPPELLHL